VASGCHWGYDISIQRKAAGPQVAIRPEGQCPIHRRAPEELEFPVGGGRRVLHVPDSSPIFWPDRRFFGFVGCALRAIPVTAAILAARQVFADPPTVCN
jgi:hypothetical protein